MAYPARRGLAPSMNVLSTWSTVILWFLSTASVQVGSVRTLCPRVVSSLIWIESV